MKSILFAACLLLFVPTLRGQSCCDLNQAQAAAAKAAEASEHPSLQFAAFAEDARFGPMHPDPLPFRYHSPHAESLTFPTPDGQQSTAFYLPSPEPSSDYVFLIHEWWGLNDYVRQEAENYQVALGNVHMIALDLYDGQVATQAQDARRYMSSVKQERAEAIIKGAIAHIGAEARIATVGWCFGGGWSLQSTLLAGDQAAGCVIYYGMPESDVAKLKQLKAPVLGIFASEDQWINEKVVETFQQNMEAADKELTVYVFEADHAFANPSSDNHFRVAAEEAFQYSVAFFKKAFE